MSASRSAWELACPPDMRRHCEAIFAGEYDVPGLDLHDPRILDIGANVGAFAAWAADRWPGARVRCYEPNPDAFAFLKGNIITDDPESLQPLGVLDIPRGTMAQRFLHFGRNNLGEASVHKRGEQRSDGAVCSFGSAADLPPCDILKLDTEGCEVEILRGYTETFGPSVLPRAILLEFHSSNDRVIIDRKLGVLGYVLVRARIDHPDRGVLAFVRAT